LKENTTMGADGGVLSPMSVTWLGLAANVLLSIGKVAAGALFGSGVLLADGLHSASDLMSDLAVLAGLHVSARPADGSHPYGHRRVQTLSAMFVGVVIIAAAAWVAVSATAQWRRNVVPSYGWIPFAIAAASVAVKEVLYRLTRAVGRRTGDAALLANAWHHRSDAFSSVAAAGGIFAVAWGGAGWGFLDHAVAIALAGVLVVVGLKLVAQAGNELVDRAPSKEVTDGIAAIVAETDGVRSYHAFRMRQLGGRREMDVHVQVDPALTVVEGHDIATRVRSRIHQADPDVTAVIVHVEPAE